MPELSEKVKAVYERLGPFDYSKYYSESGEFDKYTSAGPYKSVKSGDCYEG